MEEIEIKQIREEGERRGPQYQNAVDCAEWRKRHPPSSNVIHNLTESAEPPECGQSQNTKPYDIMKERQKNIDAIIDKQIREQSKIIVHLFPALNMSPSI